MRPRDQERFTGTMGLDDEVTFAIGNISGQQLCLSKLFSRQPFDKVQKKTNTEPSGRLDNGNDNRDYMERARVGMPSSIVFNSI